MTPTPTSTTYVRPAGPTRRRAVDVLRGLAATAALLAGVVGLPVLLATIAPLSVPSQVPTWEQVSAALLRPDGGAGLITVLALAAWAGWAVFTVCVLLEITAQARGLPTPRLPLLRGTQRLTAGIVTTAALLLASNATPAAAVTTTLVSQPAPQPAPHGAANVEAVDAKAATPTPSSSEGGAAAGAPAEAASANPARALPVVVVQRGDSLWRLAERHLGNGERFTEIVDLNLGRPQADGRTLTDAHWLTPGWHLLMPPDATGLHPAPAAADTPEPAAPTARMHEVQPGESLWRIAEDELGDPTRYPEIYALNVGQPQDDGRTLTDPDLIHPGWDLTLPTPTPVAAPATVDAAPGTSPAVTFHGGTDSDGPLTGVADDAGGTDEDRDEPASAAADALTAEPAASSAAEAAGERAVEPASLSQPLVAGVTALAAAGIIALLDRRRRRQQNRRRPGERIPMPAPASAEARTERELRRATPTLTLEDVNRALHQLAPTAQTTGRDLPAVAAVRVLPDHLEILLARDQPEGIAQFTATSPRTWTATRVALLEQDEPDRGAFADPYPALVSIGADDDGAVVLLNLEAAGTLAITGTPETTTAVLRAMACELATSQPAYSSLTVVGPDLDDLVTATGRLTPDDRPADPARDAELNRTELEDRGYRDALHARSERDPGEGWNPVIYLNPRPGGVVVPPWLAVVAVTTGHPVPDGAWTLDVDPDGTAHLDPLGLDLHASRLDDDAYRHIVGLLATATVPKETKREAAASLPVETVDTLAALPTPATEPARPDADGVPSADGPIAPRVLLLGPVQVDGAARRGDERTRRNTELIAYLALHPGASAAEVDEIIGRGQRVTAATRNTVISRARAWLGRTRDSDPYLLPYQAANGYRLHPDVRTDWDDFLRHARRGLTAGPAGAPDLAAALTLVRGRPFTGTTPGTYDWAEAITQEMISTIADVAHVLARTHLTAGDHEAAALAAAAGLIADPCNETLYRDAITAAGERGDTDQVRRLANSLQAHLDDIDEGESAEPETFALVRRLLGTGNDRVVPAPIGSSQKARLAEDAHHA